MCVCVALAQLTDNIDAMYIIPKVWPEPGNDAHVIFLNTRRPTAGVPVFRFCYDFGSSSAHRQDGPHVLYIKMTV